MRCPYCRGTGSAAGVDHNSRWRDDLFACPECAGKGWVATARNWFRAWWRSPAETPLQKAANAARWLFVALAVGGIFVFLIDVGDQTQHILAPSDVPEWLKRADPTDDDFARARTIVMNAQAEVRALPDVQDGDGDREGATVVLAISEGLSGVYQTARRNRAISPDAFNRAEDIDYLAWRAARHAQCSGGSDDEDCQEVFAQDYEDGLISYTAGALAAQREPPKPAQSKGLFSFLRNLI